jgi:hypothetical protein
MYHMMCGRFRGVLIKAIVGALLILLLGLFLYSMPGMLVKKMLGA